MDGLVRVWDNYNGQCLGTAMGSQVAGLSGATFSPNGRYVVISSLDNTIGLWDLKAAGNFNLVTGKTTSRNNSKYFMRTIFDSQGNVIFGEEDKTIGVWNPSTNKKMLSIKTNENIVPIALCTNANDTLFAYGGIGSSKAQIISKNDLFKGVKY